jgi:hypothetical protein
MWVSTRTALTACGVELRQRLVEVRTELDLSGERAEPHRRILGGDRDQTCRRRAVTGDDDVLAALGGGDELAQLGLGLVHVHLHS